MLEVDFYVVKQNVATESSFLWGKIVEWAWEGS